MKTQVVYSFYLSILSPFLTDHICPFLCSLDTNGSDNSIPMAYLTLDHQLQVHTRLLDIYSTTQCTLTVLPNDAVVALTIDTLKWWWQSKQSRLQTFLHENLKRKNYRIFHPERAEQVQLTWAFKTGAVNCEYRKLSISVVPWCEHGTKLLHAWSVHFCAHRDAHAAFSLVLQGLYIAHKASCNLNVLFNGHI